MNYSKSAERSLFFALLVTAGVFCLFKIISSDFWWHLKSGEIIYAGLGLPEKDIFSFTVPASEWINFHWLFQVIVYFIYRYFGGLTAIVVFKAVLLMAVFFLLWHTGYREENHVITAGCLILSLIAIGSRILLRPELFSFLFISVYLLILWQYKYKKKNFLWLLVVVQILWVNSHALFILGIVIVSIYLAGEFVSANIKLPFIGKDEFALKGKRYMNLLYILGACVAVSFINPYSWKLMLWPFRLYAELDSSSNIFSKVIMEYRRPLDSVTLDTWWYRVFIIFTASTFLINIKKITVTNVIIYSAFLYLSLIAARNIPLFAIAAGPLAVINLNDVITGQYLRGRIKLKEKQKKLIKLGAALFLFLITVILSWNRVTGRYYLKEGYFREFGTGYSEIFFPGNAVDFMEQNNIEGNMFNDISIGGYLAWRGYPERKVFIDGRGAVYGGDFFEYYWKAVHSPLLWERLAARYNIDYIVLGHNNFWIEEFLKGIMADKKWVMVYYDESAVIFIRNTLKNRDMIERCRSSFEEAEKVMEEKYSVPAEGTDDMYNTSLITNSNEKTGKYYRLVASGRFFSRTGSYGRAMSQFSRAIELKPVPYCPNLFYEVGYLKYLSGAGQEAAELFRQGLALNPYNPFARYNIGRIYDELEIYEKALKEYRKAFKLGLKNTVLFSRMAEISFNLGLYGKAEDYYRAWLELDTESVVAHNGLGRVYVKLGKTKAAVSEFMRSLELDPHDSFASSMLENSIKEKD
ncbi:MAG: tetratricopeptide repeat protein [Elusimicrobiota bacterium]